MPQPQLTGVIRFGVFELEPRTGILRKHGVRIRLQEQPFQVLLALLERPGEVVTREELHQRVWAGEPFGDLEHRLNIAINKIREALGDPAETPRFVETLPRRGYRFIAPVEGAPRPVPQTAANPRSLAWFAWVAAGLLVAAGAGLWLAHDRGAPPPARVVPLTAFTGVETHPAFSPDGKQVAFTWDGERQDNLDVYVKVVGDATALRLTSHPADDGFPAWSPDGRQIAFVSTRGEGGIYLVSPLGGSERKLADLATTSRPSWSKDGKDLLVARRYREEKPEAGDGALFLVPVESGGGPRQVLTPPRGTWYKDPAFAPDDRSLAFAACTGPMSGARCSLQIADLNQGSVISGQPRQITQPSYYSHGLAWMADGSSLIYSTSGSLWRVGVRSGAKPERLELAGAGTATDGAGVFYPAIDFKGGRLAFSRSVSQSDIWRLEDDGKPSPFLTSSLRDVNPQYSPDGHRIAFESGRGGDSIAVWVANADGTGLGQVTTIGSPQSGTPRWSPDGRWLAFDAFGKGGRWDVWVVEVSGSSPRQLTHGPADSTIPSWSRDGSSIYFASGRSGRFEIWRMPADGGTAVQMTHNGGFVAFESTDGKTLYYTLSEGGAEGLYARQLPDGEERQLLNEGVAKRGFAVFSDGVYYLHGRGQNNYEIRFHEFASGRSHVVGEIEGPLHLGLAVSPDRRTFLFPKLVNAGSDLMVIENFR